MASDIDVDGTTPAWFLRFSIWKTGDFIWLKILIVSYQRTHLNKPLVYFALSCREYIGLMHIY